MGTLIRPPLEELQHKAQWMSLLMLAVSMHVLEAGLPGLGPWLKPGLANVITLITLVLLGPGAALALAITRVFAGSMLIGTMLTPTFVMSFSGAVGAALVMLATWRFLPGVSLIGISLLGAVAHMLMQFVVVEALFIQQPAIYYLLPPFLLASCITGWVNGAIAAYIISRLHTGDMIHAGRMNG
ncbi:MAG: Gx transporter family protein [Mariprofundaceae bacterium]|nr:Gx transporter family protein [Mariprofundaceae bacterium]